MVTESASTSSSTTPGGSGKQDEVLQALISQVACYRKLLKLAAIQHEHIQHSRTAELLEVLQARQQVINEIESLDRTIAPARQRWAEYVAGLSPESRKLAEPALAETRALLEKITSADRNDVMVLQHRKINVATQINKKSAARHLNRNYAAAAYGATRPKMDIST